MFKTDFKFIGGLVSLPKIRTPLEHNFVYRAAIAGPSGTELLMRLTVGKRVYQKTLTLVNREVNISIPLFLEDGDEIEAEIANLTDVIDVTVGNIRIEEL